MARKGMKNRRGSPPNPPAKAPETLGVGRRELIMVSEPDAQLRVSPSGMRSMGTVVTGLSRLLASPDIRIQPLFGHTEERVRSLVAEIPDAEGLGNLETYYHVDAPSDRLDELAESLMKLDEVAAAYVKPAGEPPEINDMAPAADEAPSTTPDFSARQIYLNAAPAGIDARYAWRFRGGRGAGSRIIDCEWGWRFSHEDLGTNQGGVVIGTNHTDTNHGTAVLGEFSGDINTFGIVGICSDAVASAASFLTLPTATVIRQAADRLRAGDIMLLEIHRPGPGANGSGQDGFIAIEWWPDDLAAIRYAVSRGILVVEAAGNGFRNLDDPIYNTPSTGFPATWKNPFKLANPQSGAIVVGAGAPPPGTHGRDHGPDRSRLDFSNHGQRVDTQGWGREVTTTGYGDLQGGSNSDLWYTDTFSGTSSASPIVVGALGCIQGMLRANNRPLLTPLTARQLLRATGSPQQDAPGRPKTQRIGNRPNIKQMVGHLFGVTPESDGGLLDSTLATAGGPVELNLSGKITINVRSSDVTVNVLGESTKPTPG